MTVLMIAHRLETAVTYSDKVLVMDKGKMIEFDHSFNLLSNNDINTVDDSSPTRDTVFASMVKSLTAQQ